MIISRSTDKNRFLSKQSISGQRDPSIAIVDKTAYYTAVGAETEINALTDLDNGFSWSTAEFHKIRVIRSLAGAIIPDGPQTGAIGFDASSPPLIKFASPLQAGEVVYVELKQNVESGLTVVPTAPYLQRINVPSLSSTTSIKLTKALPLTFYRGRDRGQVYIISVDGTGPLMINPNNASTGNDYKEVAIAGSDSFSTITLNSAITGPANITIWAPGIVDTTNYSATQIITNGSQISQLQTLFTEWVDYSTSIKAVTADPSEGTVAYKKVSWRRVLDSMQLSFSFAKTAGGTAGTGYYLIPLPSGYNIDPTKALFEITTAIPTIGSLGSGNVDDGTTAVPLQVHAYDGTRLAMFDLTNYENIGSASAAYALNTAVINISFTVTIPITEFDFTYV